MPDDKKFNFIHMLSRVIRWLANEITWSFLPLRSRVDAVLRVSDLDPFVHPQSTTNPTVDWDTRFPIEGLLHLEYPTGEGFSGNDWVEIKDVMRALVRENTYEVHFPMSQLHGFLCSKCSLRTRPVRASQLTMADLGQLVDDLEDLKGLAEAKK